MNVSTIGEIVGVVIVVGIVAVVFLGVIVALLKTFFDEFLGSSHQNPPDQWKKPK